MLFMGTLVAAFLGSCGPAAELCLDLATGANTRLSLPVSPGQRVRFSFRHSLYGSRVEEQFEITRHGLRIEKLRYAESRLLEFYGHEAGRLENGSWVVEGNRRLLSTLDLRVSPESSWQMTLGLRTLLLWQMVETGGAARVAVSSCAKERHQ